jgi:hypothetical protein
MSVGLTLCLGGVTIVQREQKSQMKSPSPDRPVPEERDHISRACNAGVGNANSTAYALDFREAKRGASAIPKANPQMKVLIRSNSGAGQMELRSH